MLLPTVRISIAVRIENGRSIRAIAQPITRTLRDHLMQDCRSVARISIAVPIDNVRSFGAIAQTVTRTTEAVLDAAPDAFGGCSQLAYAQHGSKKRIIARMT